MGVNATSSDAVPQFGHLVRQHRIRVGLTQQELADFSTISVRAIRDLEQGRARRPRQDTVRLLADGLRLGPRARAALEVAADEGRTSWALKGLLDADPPAPPVALDAIFGRERETAVIEEELSTGAERLVTVVGLSGVGKTRLALDVAARVHTAGRFPVLWFAFPDPLDAGPLTDRHDEPAGGQWRPGDAGDRLAEVVRECATELSATAGSATANSGAAGSGAAGSAAPHDAVALSELVGDRPALLVLDGAGPLRPDRLAVLLRDCPQMRLLVTSERVSGVPGERPFLLTPLECPDAADERDPATLEQVPAVRLFVDRVRRIRPGYELTTPDVDIVADICRRLDGLPLALRAAASWLVVYDLPTLRHCLRNDMASLLDHLAGADGGCSLPEIVERCLDSLTADERALLAVVSGRDGDFALADVVEATGRSLPDSGRMVRDLVLYGVVRPAYQHDGFVFRVLNVVRAVQRCVGGGWEPREAVAGNCSAPAAPTAVRPAGVGV